MILLVQPQSQLAPFPSIISQDIDTTSKSSHPCGKRDSLHKKSSVLLSLFRVIIAIRKI